MRVVVTRPSPQAEAWSERLRARGIDAVALPLLAIEGPPDAAAVERARASLGAFDWVVFVSPIAVGRFFAEGGAAVGWPSEGVRAAAPGAGTAAALRAAGIPANRVVAPDAAGRSDSEALWATMSGGTGESLRGDRVLVVRGTEGRDWLADRLLEAGARVETVAAYRRVDAVLDADARHRLDAALAEPATHAWLVASASAVDALVRAAAGEGRPLEPGFEAGSTRLGRATAVTTHPRIAERARAAGFGRVLEADAGVESVVRCIESAEP